jgi:multidrug efflux pump subunit AcrB
MWKFFVKSPRFSMVLLLALTLLGIFSIIDIDKESNPEVNIPFVIVSTPFPGANAVDVERFVTAKLEDSIIGLEDVKKVTSTSSLGFSSIAVEYEIGTDIDKRIRDLENAVEIQKFQLPTEAGDTRVAQVNFNDSPIKVFSISGPYDVRQLRILADELANRLERVSGLSEARVSGGQDRLIEVRLNEESLRLYGLNFQQIINSVSQASSNVPIGEIEKNDQRYSLRFDGVISDFDQIARILVRGGNSPVFLGDVASVEDTFEDVKVKSYFGIGENIESAVSIGIFKKSGGNILRVVDGADAVIEKAREDLLPEGIVIDVIDDTAEYIRTDLTNLAVSGLQTTLIVVILILLLLGWREALLAGLSIPLTFLITFIFLNSFGYTLNFLSLFSLILSLGILVDAAIVMTEAVYENKQLGLKPTESALKAIDQFQTPLIAGTLTTVFAFFPMLLTSGIIGEFIKSIPVTVSMVLFSALFIALAMIPTLFVILFTERKSGNLIKFGRVITRVLAILLIITAQNISLYLFGLVVGLLSFVSIKKMARLRSNALKVVARVETAFFGFTKGRDVVMNRLWTWYRNLLIRFVANKKLQRMLALFLSVAFVASLSLPVIGLLKIDMFPATDMERVYVDLKLPAGTTLTETEEVMFRFKNYFSGRSEIDSYLVTIGGGSSIGGGQSLNLGSFTLNLVEGKRPDSRDLLEIYDRDLKNIYPNGKLIVQQLGSGPEQGAPVAISIYGDDLNVLDDLANRVLLVVDGLESTRNVQNSVEDVSGEIVFVPKENILGFYGVQAVQIALLARTAVFGQEVMTLQSSEDDIPVVLKYNSDLGMSLDRLRSLVISTQQGNVPISTLVDIKFLPSRSAIAREDGNRVVTITAGIRTGYAIQDVFAEIEQEVSKISLPEGYTIRVGGQNEDTDQSFADLGRAMIIGIFLIAALLVWQFNSFRQPLYVISSIPLALIGVLPGLTLIGQPLSFPGMIGVVALAGIVVNNGIILVDTINENRVQGMDKMNAVIEGCVSRLRPILLTTITTVAGLLPLVITQPSWAPLGFAIIFGLMFSTILTLLVVPLLYNRFE